MNVWKQLKLNFLKKKQLEAELTALKEEVQGNFYYQQLDTDKERRVYLQFVNGLSKRMQVIDIDSVNDEIYSRVYFLSLMIIQNFIG